MSVADRDGQHTGVVPSNCGSCPVISEIVNVFCDNELSTHLSKQVFQCPYVSSFTSSTQVKSQKLNYLRLNSSNYSQKNIKTYIT